MIDLLIQLNDVVVAAVVGQIGATVVVAVSDVDAVVVVASVVVAAFVAVVVSVDVVVNSLPYHFDYDIVHSVMNWALCEPPYVIHP